MQHATTHNHTHANTQPNTCKHTTTHKKANETGSDNQDNQVNLLKEVDSEKVSAIVGDWEEIELAVDSGATETVIGESMISSIETKPGEASRRGAKYEVADGNIIKKPRRKTVRGRE